MGITALKISQSDLLDMLRIYNAVRSSNQFAWCWLCRVVMLPGPVIQTSENMLAACLMVQPIQAISRM